MRTVLLLDGTPYPCEAFPASREQALARLADLGRRPRLAVFSLRQGPDALLSAPELACVGFTRYPTGVWGMTLLDRAVGAPPAQLPQPEPIDFALYLAEVAAQLDDAFVYGYATTPSREGDIGIELMTWRGTSLWLHGQLRSRSLFGCELLHLPAPEGWLLQRRAVPGLALADEAMLAMFLKQAV